MPQPQPIMGEALQGNLASWLPAGVGAASMGLEQDSTFSGRTFVDLYGSGFGRDIEPTQARVAWGLGFRNR